MGQVSIITPTYNSAKHIVKTIKSVQNQSYQLYEHIIVDDCSTDGTREIVSEYSMTDPRIKLMKLEQNSGAGVARNSGIEIAKGRYVAFLDSDDFWHSEKLEKQISILKTGEYAIVYSQYYVVDEEGKILYKINSPKKVNRQQMLRNDYIGFLTLIYDTEKLGKPYMSEIRRRQDWTYKLRLLKNCDVAYGIQEPLAYYRKGNASLSSNKIRLLKYNFIVYRRELGLSTFNSFLKMGIFLIHNFWFKLTSRKRVRYIET